jgi:predicted dehydrogenase
VGVAALEAGKHVSVQKPIAISVRECDALIEASKRSGKMLRVFENFQYYPPMVKAKGLLDAGAVGEPLSIRIKAVQGTTGRDWTIPYRRWSWRFDSVKCGGGRVILDYGYHLFSIAMWFLGDVEKVYSWITHRTIQNNWVLDSPAVAMWKYKNAEKYGTYEVITSDNILVKSKYRRPEDEWIELSGSHGFIWVNRCTSELLDKPVVVMYRDGVTTSFSDVDSDWGASFINGINDFIDAVREGRQAPVPRPPRASERNGPAVARHDALHRWRKERAAARGVESDVILSREVLWRIAERGPCSLEELAAVEGLGPSRLRCYGEEILQVLANSDRLHPQAPEVQSDPPALGPA